MTHLLKLKGLDGPYNAKGLVAELVPSHVQNAWVSREERVRIAGLAACCNYFKKKKKWTI